ncbi:MAG: chitobiase/beta-hexosaminidase C-terminal domain-containing protein [Kiritimatiellae bacterium]|nr:chitobiase/beta-hexosaminidase C-terminal domain-containing protein [Kiritimatiellia bacterium]
MKVGVRGVRSCGVPVLVLLFLCADASRCSADVLVAKVTSWSYRKGTAEASDPRSEWRQIDFDDSSWPRGQAAFGYGVSGLNTSFADMANTYSTFFLRKTFSVASLDTDTRLRATVDFDDGFILWINGERVLEANEPDGDPLQDSLASDYHEPGSNEVYEVGDVEDFLELGPNVVAVQVFNRTLDSGDAKFDVLLETFKRVADTRFSHDRGFYDAGFHVTISTGTAGATIRYTTNGTKPTESYGTVGGTNACSVPITTTTCLRAAAFKSGYEPANVDTHTYLFVDDVVEQPDDSAGGFWGPTEMDPQVVNAPAYSNMIRGALKSIPTLSIVMKRADMFDSVTGIYANPEVRGDAWERETSIEFIYPNDPSESFQEDCGIQLGGRSDQPKWGTKNSFNIYFRSLYGAGKLRRQICPGGQVAEYDVIRLRANGNDKWAASTDEAYSRPEAQLIRDEFGRRAQREMGWHAASGVFVHLYINGQYWGVYNPTERPDDGFAEAHFGGESADYDVMKQGYVLVDGTNTHWNAMINYANANNLADAAKYAAMQDYLDIPQFIDYNIIEIYGPNMDWSSPTRAVSGNNWRAIRKSRNRLPGDPNWQFYVWDYEYTMEMGAAAGLYTNMAVTGSIGDLHKNLKVNLDYKTLFSDRIYAHFFNNGLMTADVCSNRYLSVANDIHDAIVCESARYGDHLSGDANDPVTRDGDWLPFRNHLLSDWFPYRSGIVFSQFKNLAFYPQIDAPEFNQHGGAISTGFKLTMSKTISNATIYYTVDGSDPRLPGGSKSGARLEYASPVTLSCTTHVKARLYKSNTTWSAVHAATFNYTAHYSNLRITEIMYNPLGGGDYEFVEIKNTGSSTRGLSEMRVRGIDYTFPPGAELAGGAFAVLVRNEAAFTNRYPAVKGAVALFDEYGGSLDNGGERVTLADCEGRTVVSVRYDDADPWPKWADGDGYSLVPVATNGYYSDTSAGDPANWRLSNLIGGSPGRDDGEHYRVLINEVLSHTDWPEVDAVELFNAGSATADIGGWYLSDSDNAYQKYQIPADTLLPAGGTLVFDEADFNTDTNEPACFALNSHGDEVYLTHWDGNGNLLYLDDVSFGAAPNGVAFGRFVKSDGGADFEAQSVTHTLGAANAYPAVGPVVVNEVMYHAADGGAYDFIELLSISDAPQNLSNGTNGWRLNGVGYEFATGVVAQAGEYLLVTATNESAFRAKYPDVPPGIRFFGPYPGTLRNNGESLRLERPDDADEEGVPWILVDRVSYNDNSPWPESSDGRGPSLERIAPSLYGNDSANWSASKAAGGTPGAPNSGVLVPMTAGWKFHDRGEDLGTAWRAAAGAFDDLGWADGNGPLGYADVGYYPEIDTELSYGENPAGKHMTTYFRKTFCSDINPLNVTNLTLRAKVDDGFVAYLNGQEVQRASMPGGAVAYETAATSHSATSYETFDLNSYNAVLLAGLNVLAVEVHQAAADSSDLFMDLALACERIDSPTVETPVVSPPNGSSFSNSVQVTLATGTAGATLFYTLDGVTPPTTNSTRYVGAFTLTDTTTVQARGFKQDYTPSSIAVAVLTKVKPPAATPAISPNGGPFYDSVEVALSTATAGATLFYTTDGSTPSTGSAAYAAAFTLTRSTTLKARAYHADYSASDVAEAAFSNKCFTAYNDLAWFSGQRDNNITTYTTTNEFASGVRTGPLADFASGQAVEAALTVDGGSGVIQSQGAHPYTNTDAYAVFDGKVDCESVISYGSENLTLTLDGLDQNLRYELVVYSDRNGSSYTGASSRYHYGTLSGALSFENAGTAGTAILTVSQTDDTTKFNAGYNNPSGYVSRFRNIDPGPDGQVVLTLKRDDGLSYYPYANALMLKATQAQGQQVVVKIEKGATWKYRRGTQEPSDPATAWRSIAFNDSGWESGATILGYGDTNYTYATVLSDMQNTYSTAFMRRPFTVDDPSFVSEVRLWALYDDGFIMWVNGEEVARVNVDGAEGAFMPYNSFSAGNQAGTWSDTLAGTDMPGLHAGTNVLAVQMFNTGLSSGDLTIDAELAVLEGSPLPGGEDADADGMDDEWETAQFGGTSASNGGRNEDYDGDGICNIDEYIAGTAANSTGSTFDVDVESAGGELIVSFDTVEATGAGYEDLSRHYALEQLLGLDEGLWLGIPGYTNITGTGQPVAYTNGLGGAARYYRARVWLQ